MFFKAFPTIDAEATGMNIRRLRIEKGLTVRDLQNYFGFEEPQAIYKWQRGESLPSVDNLYALGNLLEVPMEQILVSTQKLHLVKEQQTAACCSDHFLEVFLPVISRKCSVLPGARGTAVCGPGKAILSSLPCIALRCLRKSYETLQNPRFSAALFSGTHPVRTVMI